MATGQQAKEEWGALESYHDALRLSRLFLNGKRQCSIYEASPATSSLSSLFPGLLHLHAYGLLIYEAQPYGKEEPQFIPYKEEMRLSIYTVFSDADFWYERYRRPYLCFLLPQSDYIPKKALETFCASLLLHPTIVTIIHYPDKSFRTNMLKHHSVTVDRCAPSLDGLGQRFFEDLREIPRDYYQVAEGWDIKVIKQTNCLNIEIASRSFEEDVDLVKLVGEVAKAVGMEPCYADAE
ncbi:MAG: hypothetical protein Q9186_007138 [Xanthomendoza sp. 1 TL-2023]